MTTTAHQPIAPRIDDTERLDSLAKLAEFRERIVIDMRAHERGGFDVAIYAEGGTYLSGDGHETPLYALRGAIDQLHRGEST